VFLVCALDTVQRLNNALASAGLARGGGGVAVGASRGFWASYELLRTSIESDKGIVGCDVVLLDLLNEGGEDGGLFLAD
jgi:hypothetical protein